MATTASFGSWLPPPQPPAVRVRLGTSWPSSAATIKSCHHLVLPPSSTAFKYYQHQVLPTSSAATFKHCQHQEMPPSRNATIKSCHHQVLPTSTAATIKNCYHQVLPLGLAELRTVHDSTCCCPRSHFALCLNSTE